MDKLVIVAKGLLAPLAHPVARTIAGVVLIGMAVLDSGNSSVINAAAGVLLCEQQ